MVVQTNLIEKCTSPNHKFSIMATCRSPFPQTWLKVTVVHLKDCPPLLLHHVYFLSFDTTPIHIYMKKIFLVTKKKSILTVQFFIFWKIIVRSQWSDFVNHIQSKRDIFFKFGIFIRILFQKKKKIISTYFQIFISVIAKLFINGCPCRY